MRQTPKVEGTKIAQAAKDLNVTSVTIRRYLTEFNIETATDENGIKVLPLQAMEELKMVRSLKEDGLTNPKVMELLEANRAEGPKEPSPKAKDKDAPRQASKSKVAAAPEESEAPEPKRGGKRQIGARGMVEADKSGVGDQVVGLFAAIVGMGAPGEVRQQAGRAPQPRFLVRLLEMGSVEKPTRPMEQFLGVRGGA